MTGYTKLFGSIIASTIWRESKETKIVWITLLAMANQRGIAEASVPGLADFARVTIPECQEALQVLMAPDPHSRTKDHEGRRIEEVDGGWLLLNHSKYRAKMNADDRREYLRQKQQEWRKNHKPVNTTSTNVNKRNVVSTPSTQSEAEAEAEAVQSNKQINNGHPSLEEVKTAASMMAMNETDAVAFWNHFESSGWIDKNGHPIVSWRAKMGNWKTVSRASQFETAHRIQRPMGTLDMKTIIDAKTTLAAELRTRYCSDTALGSHWQDDSKKSEYFTLKREVKALRQQLSNMA